MRRTPRLGRLFRALQRISEIEDNTERPM